MGAVLALSPIAAILGLMLLAHVSAAAAGAAGLAIGLAVAVLAFGFARGADGAAADLLGLAAEGGFLTATILWILFNALAIHELQGRLGSVDRLRASLGRLTGVPALQAILIGWFFALFLEGAAGFGTPVALAAPLLVTLGFAPVTAVSIALVGHAGAVAFGAVGTPIMAQIGISALPEAELSTVTALLGLALGPILLIAFHRVAADSPQNEAPSGLWRWTAFAGAAFLLPYAAIGALLGPELPALGGAVVGLGLFVWRLRRGGGPPAPQQQGRIGAGRLARSLLPYLLLIALILLTRLVPGLREALSGYTWEWRLPAGYSGAFAPLYHPGTMLFAGFVLGGLLQGASPGDLAAASGRAAARLLPVLLALVTMITLSRLMVHAGMVETLAAAAAAGVGALWPLLAPSVGALGSFVTGSATGSNILFTGLQAATAQQAGLAATPIVAGQGVGAAIGNIICPHNIVAGAATVGLAGREAAILRRMAPICLAYVTCAGLLLTAAILLA